MGSDYGVRNLNTTAGIYVEATNNYWNASDGPGSTGPFEDPVTGALANGSGTNVTNVSSSTTANVHFDPYLGAEPGPDFGVVIDSTNADIVEGETLLVDAVIENLDAGDQRATQTVELVVDGSVVDSVTQTLWPGETGIVTLSWDTSGGDAGTYSVAAASSADSDTVSVSVDAGSSSSSSGSSSSTTEPTATPSPSPTATPTSAPTVTPTATASPPSTPTATATASPSPSPPSTATDQPTDQPTATETPGQPGFGLAVALLAVALFGLTRRRRN